MSLQKDNLRSIADGLIAATNALDVERVLNLFTPDAVVDDPSTGHRFDGHAGIRNYIEQYFIGYHTVTRFLRVSVATAPACGSTSPATSDMRLVCWRCP